MVTTGICVQVYSSNSQIDAKILSNGFTLVDTFTEIDAYYTHLPKHIAKDCSYIDLVNNSILVRTIKGANSEKHFLVYKDKTINDKNEVIKEEKISTLIENGEKAKQIFSNSGMYNWSRLITHQKEYVKGDLHLSVQSIPDLGVFLEITEDNSVLQGFSDTMFKHLTYIANSLGLDLGSDFSCKKAYMKFKKSLMAKN